MTDSNRPSPTELKELMTKVFDSDASDAFGEFMMRRAALSDLAPKADEALLDGVDAVAGRRGCHGGGAPAQHVR